MQPETRALPTGAGEGTGRFVDAGEVLLAMQDVLGRKWHPIIVYALLEGGPTGFSDLEGQIEGISSKMLSESLTALEADGLVAREIVDDRPVRVEYSLTAPGRKLGDVVVGMVRWGADHLDADEGGRPERTGALATDGGHSRADRPEREKGRDFAPDRHRESRR